MGLGLHGGGIASARFLASHGAELTITDLRDEETLRPSIEQLRDLSIRYVLGRHEMEDFSGADMVVKNPAVPRQSPYLREARRVETDLTLFLRLNRRPVLAVTGSKGKSTTVSALHAIVKRRYPDTLLGGNITISPLTFADECLRPSQSPVILELSSWQLADIIPAELLKARIALITNIMADHQNAYSSMDDYVADKRRIFHGQGPGDDSICPYDDAYRPILERDITGRRLYFSARELPAGLDGACFRGNTGRIRIQGEESAIVPEETVLPGIHNRVNLLAAGMIAFLYGIPADIIREETGGFTGIEHRLELLDTGDGLRWYNDSAATIPEATGAALCSLKGRVHLITGGTDKKLNFTAFQELAHLPATIHLLAGSATERMIEILRREGVPFNGPFDSLQEAVDSAAAAAIAGDSVLFSPGSTSFGMFLNEFDRGRRFKEIVAEKTGTHSGPVAEIPPSE